ncbi:hypothetical protein AB1P65_09355 [Roseibium alexandrii]
MHHEIEINTYLPLDAGSATLIEDVPVKLTIRGENDGCNELHWWVHEIRAEMVGTDIVGTSDTLRSLTGSYNVYISLTLRDHVICQLIQKAEKDEAVEADVIEQLYPLVFGKEAA